MPRDASPSNDDTDPAAHPRPRFDHGTVDCYYEVFDPFTRDGLVVGSLTDDLSDTYADLQKGLALLDRGEPEGAVWSWRFSFDAHWGDHLVDALRMLRRVNAGNARDILWDDPGE